RARKSLRTRADIKATTRGFALAPRRAREVVVLARPVEDEHAAVLAFLADGESWSSSALALALGTSQRTVQRALDSLAAAGKVQSFGRARARRSEERRVGKECRSRWSPDHLKKKKRKRGREESSLQLWRKVAVASSLRRRI